MHALSSSNNVGFGWCSSVWDDVLMQCDTQLPPQRAHLSLLRRPGLTPVLLEEQDLSRSECMDFMMNTLKHCTPTLVAPIIICKSGKTSDILVMNLVLILD